MMKMETLFPDEDYRFHLRLERGTVRGFFESGEGLSERLAERRRWLSAVPGRHAAMLPEATPMLDELVELCGEAKCLDAGGLAEVRRGGTPLDRCLELGSRWEPDFLLLKAESDGGFRLRGGCVCFPSSWSLIPKMGRSVSGIHEVVPGLNPALEGSIDRFLHRLKPGGSWERYNWGLSRSAELNQDPGRKLPRLDSGVGLEEIWLRIEHQAFVTLPRSGGVLFAIRMIVRPLQEVRREPKVAGPLARALRTMPEALAEYKGFAGARGRILDLMEA
jgi:dimethylamine monooxygenase subunit A